MNRKQEILFKESTVWKAIFAMQDCEMMCENCPSLKMH